MHPIHLSIAAVLVLSVPMAVTTTTLYDGSAGGTPGSQGVLSYQAVNFSGGAVKASETYDATSKTTILDSTAQQSDGAGYSADLSGTTTITPDVPATLTFRAQVEQESHAKNNRAGFSVILLNNNKLGIEIGFWQNEIWAQEGGTTKLFTKAESVAFDTSAATTYRLTFSGNAYTLSANGTPILSGALRDYAAAQGLYDPYETPNFVFFGDDTSSAVARTRLAAASLAVGTPGQQVPQLYLPLLTK